MKINWIVCLVILAAAIMWQLGFKLLGWNEVVGFFTSFIVCWVLAVSLEAVKIK